MKPKISRGAMALMIILAIVVLDQVLKIWVKTSFYLGEDREVLPFFHLRFVENPGMAFGWQLGSKIFLTLFRIVVVGLLGWYLVKLRHLRGIPVGYIVCVALIIAGAAGNIFDCVFYGEVFNDPAPPAVASCVPWGEGYGSLFEGKVVDMLYFPIFSFNWPEWLPLLGGKEFSFFDPVFNLADAAITIGIIVLILFYRRYVMLTKQEQVDKVLLERQGKSGDKTTDETPSE